MILVIGVKCTVCLETSCWAGHGAILSESPQKIAGASPTVAWAGARVATIPAHPASNDGTMVPSGAWEV